MISSKRARRLGALAAVAALPFATAASPALAMEGVGGADTTSASDQYGSGPDTTVSTVDRRDPGDTATTTAAGAGRKADAKRSGGKQRRGGKRRGKSGASGGVKGEEADGRGRASDPDAGVLGDGATGTRRGDRSGVLGTGRDGAASGGATLERAQLRAGSSLPFTGIAVVPVALLGLGLLATGVLLRRHRRD